MTGLGLPIAAYPLYYDGGGSLRRICDKGLPDAPTIGWRNDPNGLSFYQGGATCFTSTTPTPSNGSLSAPWTAAITSVAKDGRHDTIIRYKPDESTLKIDHCRSGLPRDIVNTGGQTF